MCDKGPEEKKSADAKLPLRLELLLELLCEIAVRIDCSKRDDKTPLDEIKAPEREPECADNTVCISDIETPEANNLRKISNAVITLSEL
jgi:hypothetical protein